MRRSIPGVGQRARPDPGSWPSSPTSTRWSGSGPGPSSGSRRGSRRGRPSWASRRRPPWCGRAGRWQVQGTGAVWILDAAPRARFAAGDEVPLARPPVPGEPGAPRNVASANSVVESARSRRTTTTRRSAAMPAVTVDDILSLPQLEVPGPARRRSGPWCRSPTRRRASRARASRCGGPSPASTWPSSTPSCTWTRWARSSTGRASPGARRGTPTGASRP